MAIENLTKLSPGSLRTKGYDIQYYKYISAIFSCEYITVYSRCEGEEGQMSFVNTPVIIFDILIFN